MIRRQNPLYRFSRSDNACSSRCHRSDTISSMRIPSLSIADRNGEAFLTDIPVNFKNVGFCLQAQNGHAAEMQHGRFLMS
ncbi:MAG TPA: hypothetical protein IAA46_07910 [Candidatus Gemmiger avium]|nr:hypothetical protein [Candidatus Gemmiger avium]